MPTTATPTRVALVTSWIARATGRANGSKPASSGSGRSKMSSISAFGTTRVWPSRIGRISRNARKSSSSRRIWAGISRSMMRVKIDGIGGNLSTESRADALRDGLRDEIDCAFPVQALQERRVRSVERAKIGAAGEPQVQRISLHPGRRAVRREVEALEAHLRVGVHCQRQAMGELGDQIIVGLHGR